MIRTSCRVCGGPLTPILSLGEQQIAGAFKDAVQRRVPLDLMRCDTQKEGACGLVQLRHTVPGYVLYDSYWYRSGVNRTMTDNLHEIARQAEGMVDVGAASLVVDVGCNDGTLLDGYTVKAEKIGYDPSSVASYAEAKGHKVRREFYDGKHRKAKVITSIAMLYDLDDPHRFVQMVAGALHSDGVWVAELHYLPSMLATTGFDAVVHEHLCYYSLSVLERLVGEHGLEVVKAELNGVNGGSIRLFIGHTGRHERESLRGLRVAEFEQALDTAQPYERFARRVLQAGSDLHGLLVKLADGGKVVHVYGASTKGNVVLQYANIGPQLAAVAADRNPDKYGTVTATGIPVVSEEESRASNPDFYLVLPWHFIDEFVDREREWLAGGGRFIVPLPEVKIL